MWAQKCKEQQSFFFALHLKVSSHSRQKTKDKKPWFTSSKANQNETTFRGSSGQYIESWVGFIYILVQILVYSDFDRVSLLF